MDQFECVKLQTLNKDSYYVYFPKILRTFFLEREYIHQFLPYKKKLVICYLDNYKAKKLSFKHVKEIPSKMKHFQTIQFGNSVLICGGMNIQQENPEDMLSKQFDHVFDEAFVINVKSNQCELKTQMKMKRAKHCIAIADDPKDQFNKIVIVVGGIYVTYHRDLFKKTTSQKTHDTDLVEYYSLKDKQFERYNARLCIARHEASACYLNNYLFVIGGHTVQHPHTFINTIERCHKSVPSSYFQKIDVNQRHQAVGVDLSLQTHLTVSIPEDNGILILGNQAEDPYCNEAYFIDLKDFKMKRSDFKHRVGPINNWKNSYKLYEQRINFLTDQLQVLRFENQGCQWTLFDVHQIANERSKEEMEKRIEKKKKKEEKAKSKANKQLGDYQDGYVYEDGRHHYYEDSYNHRF